MWDDDGESSTLHKKKTAKRETFLSAFAGCAVRQEGVGENKFGQKKKYKVQVVVRSHVGHPHALEKKVSIFDWLDPAAAVKSKTE